jgi:hypothetical protein
MRSRSMLSAAYCNHILLDPVLQIDNQNQPDIVIIWLLLSVSLGPKVITISGRDCSIINDGYQIPNSKYQIVSDK